MAKLVAPPPRFTTEEWTLSNNTNYSTAEQNRKIAEHIRAEADRLVKETDETTEKAQQETTKRIDQRLTDINHWTSQVCIKLTPNPLRQLSWHMHNVSPKLTIAQINMSL